MTVTVLQADAERLPLADQSVDLVFGSPPYTDCRTYDDGTLPEGHVVSRSTQEWVDWMLRVTTEALRVSRGAVVWVVGCPTRDRNYQPAAEGLMWEWFRRGLGHAYRPCYWHRVGVPGSGGDQWFRADVEYCLCFKRPGKLPWTDNVAMGHPPKWAPGGEMAYRLSDGTRVNQWGKPGVNTGTTATGNKEKASIGKPRPSHRSQQAGKMRRMAEASDEPKVQAALAEMPPGAKFHTKETENGERVQVYIPPALANPGTLIHTNTGGGQLGDYLAHENEAPFPEDLAEWFILSLCPPAGTVCDPFSGSGTTAKVAHRHGRSAIAIDIRSSQVALTKRRTKSVQKVLV